MGEWVRHPYLPQHPQPWGDYHGTMSRPKRSRARVDLLAFNRPQALLAAIGKLLRSRNPKAKRRAKYLGGLPKLQEGVARERSQRF